MSTIDMKFSSFYITILPQLEPLQNSQALVTNGRKESFCSPSHTEPVISQILP